MGRSTNSDTRKVCILRNVGDPQREINRLLCTGVGSVVPPQEPLAIFLHQAQAVGLITAEIDTCIRRNARYGNIAQPLATIIVRNRHGQIELVNSLSRFEGLQCRCFGVSNDRSLARITEHESFDLAITLNYRFPTAWRGMLYLNGLKGVEFRFASIVRPITCAMVNTIFCLDKDVILVSAERRVAIVY